MDSVRDELVAALAAAAGAGSTFPSDGAPGEDGRDAPCVGRPSPTRAPATLSPLIVVGTQPALPVGAARLTLGRAATAAGAAGVDLAVEGPLVSRRHAEVWADGDVVLCRDLGSRNGTVRVRGDERHDVGGVLATVLSAGDQLVTAEDTFLLCVVEPTAPPQADGR